MEFLLPFGITKETIAQVIKNNDETLIENLICDQEMAINNLNYFKEILKFVQNDLRCINEYIKAFRNSYRLNVEAQKAMNNNSNNNENQNTNEEKPIENK